MTHPNEERLRAAYDAFGRGDIDAVTQDWADDIVWHITGQGPLVGDLAGKMQILQFLGELVRLSNGTFRLEVEKILADDEHALVFCRSFATVAGENDEDLACHVYRLRDGKVCEAWFMFAEAQRSDELLWKAQRELTATSS